MPKPLSREVRELIIYHKQKGNKNADISEWLQVSVKSVKRIWQMYRKENTIEPKVSNSGRRAAFCEAKLIRPDVQWLRGEWVEYIKYIDINRLVYLDETGVSIGMTRLYGRAPKGERIYEYVPDVRYSCISVLSTVRVDGTTNPFVYKGSLNGFLFAQYIWECVVPLLRPYDILVMDRLSSHMMPIISEMVESVGANVVYLPPYSPDFNPIETMFSQIKSDLRRDKPRYTYAICDSLTYAFYSLTPEQTYNHFVNAIYNIRVQP